MKEPALSRPPAKETLERKAFKGATLLTINAQLGESSTVPTKKRELALFADERA